jgi:hypothetical protein
MAASLEDVNRASGWDWFCAWAFVGALCAFAFVSMASIGLFVAPFALLALFLVGRRGVRGPEVLGLVAGVGAIVILIGALNTDGHGSLDPRLWFGAGAALVATSVVAYSFARRSN